MELSGTQQLRNFQLFQELLSCGTAVYSWLYDPSGEVLSTNCPDLVLDTIFSTIKCKEYMLDYARRETAPLVLSAPLGLMWCAAFERRDGALFRCWVIGPVFTTEISFVGIEQAVQRYQIPGDWRAAFQKLLQSLPVVLTPMFFQYGLMLHCCATGEKVSVSDIQFQKGVPVGEQDRPIKSHKDRHQTYMAEQALLRNIREGDLNYQSDLARAGQLSQGVQISTDTPITQAVITEAVFISLCTRAAIQGGLSPEEAYSIGDGYIQQTTSCKSISELRNLGHAMYEDFILRVRKARTSPELSAQIRACRDYIELHLEEELPLELLAQKAGYAPFYLSRKFRQEMNCTVGEYIRFARVERAKGLLQYSGESIHSIAARLRFCSASYFSKTFQSVTGLTPHQWRERAGQRPRSAPSEDTKTYSPD